MSTCSGEKRKKKDYIDITGSPWLMMTVGIGIAITKQHDLKATVSGDHAA